MDETKNQIPSGVEVITGLRPSQNLTVANYVGAVKPIVELQEDGRDIILFVADFHGLTDTEPEIVEKYTNEIVADYIALGVNPEKVPIYIQSAISTEVLSLTMMLARHISAAELLRVPVLKDKLKESENPENANALLLLYPVMMAADIFIPRARIVPVGKDQLPHIEVTRKLARRFNDTYAPVFPVPEYEEQEVPNILSLKGPTKMSKSYPEGAIFLTDDIEAVKKKIKRAETAEAGTMSPSLKSHVLLIKNLASTTQQVEELDLIIQKHMSGEQVMAEFKDLFTTVTVDFLTTFQEKRVEVTADPLYVEGILEKGNEVARDLATETMEMVNKALHS